MVESTDTKPKTLYCANGKDCSYGQEVEDDDGMPRVLPAEAYSQQGHSVYRGLCLNCLDDFNRYPPEDD